MDKDRAQELAAACQDEMTSCNLSFLCPAMPFPIESNQLFQKKIRNKGFLLNKKTWKESTRT